jgi:D-galactarolactone cycloisomerase
LKIVDVQVHLVAAVIPLADQVVSGAGHKLSREAALIEVTVDDGLSGVGPCSFGSVSFELTFVRILVENVFKPVLVGQDPFATERIWQSLYYGHLVRTFGDRGVGVAILSAIDIALWDLKGKALSVPVYRLLGGPVRETMPAYASSVYWSSVEDSVAQTKAFVQRGYKAVKVKVGRDFPSDVERVEAIVAAVGGGSNVMVDANLAYNRNSALRFGRELDRLGVLFFEEPITLDDVDGYGRLATELDTMVAVGENTYTRWGFLPYLDAGVDIVQPDSSRCGGISEARRVAELASAQNRLVAPHTFSDAFTLAANLQLALAIDAAFILEVDETFNPLMTKLVRSPINVVEGEIQPPTEPGLGIELDRDWLDDHRYSGGHGIGPGVRPGAAGYRGGVG